MTSPGPAPAWPELPEIAAGVVQLVPSEEHWEVRAAVGGVLLGRITVTPPPQGSTVWRLGTDVLDPDSAGVVADAAHAAARYLTSGAGLQAVIDA